MSSALALLICTIFVLFLLRIDRKQFPNVSISLWIPTIWMLFIATKPLGYWLGMSGEDMEARSFVDQAFLTTLFCLALLILVKRQFNWSRAIRKNIWVILLIGYMLTSILWSDTPFISFKRWIREIIAVVMAFVVFTEEEPRQALQSIFRRTIYILIPLSYILIHYFPELGRLYGRWSGAEMWIGVALHKNSLCRLCLFSAFFLIWTLIRRWQGRDIPIVRYQTFLEAFLLILTLWLMGGPPHSFSYSVTTNVSFAVGLLALIALLWMKKRGTVLGPKALIALIAFIIVYGTVTPFIGGLSLMDISSAFGREKNLTGRTDIWAILLPHVMERPIFGSGFGGFWTAELHKLTSSHAHNGYLEIILGLGFIGLLLFAIFFMSTCRKAQRAMTRDFDWGVLIICYLLMALVHNITEASVAEFSIHLTAVILFLVASLPIKRDENVPDYKNFQRETPVWPDKTDD